MSQFEKILRRLIAGQVEFVVIGGYAAVTHGAIDVTRDLDVCAPFTEENLLKLQAALAEIRPHHRLTMHVAPLELIAGQCERWRNLYLKTDEGIFDCLGEVLGIGDYRQVFARSEITATSFGNFRVLDIPSLIEAKIAIGRPHDLRTAVQLRCVLDAKTQPPPP